MEKYGEMLGNSDLDYDYISLDKILFDIDNNTDNSVKQLYTDFDDY